MFAVLVALIDATNTLRVLSVVYDITLEQLLTVMVTPQHKHVYFIRLYELRFPGLYLAYLIRFMLPVLNIQPT